MPVTTPQEFLACEPALRVDAIVVGKNGQKSAQLSNDGSPLVLKLGTQNAPLHCPFC